MWPLGQTTNHFSRELLFFAPLLPLWSSFSFFSFLFFANCHCFHHFTPTRHLGAFAIHCNSNRFSLLNGLKIQNNNKSCSPKQRGNRRRFQRDSNQPFWHQQSLRSHFFSPFTLTFEVNVNWRSAPVSAGFQALNCCHVIGWIWWLH